MSVALPYPAGFRLLLALLLASFAVEPAQAKGALDDCWAKSENRVELGACLEELQAKTDGKLAKTYASALEAQDELDRVTGRPEARRALVRAQMAFALYRNLECRVQELQAGSGTGSGNFFQGCWIDLTGARVAALRALAPRNPPQDLAGTGWLATEVEGRALPDDPQTTLSFESDTEVSGSGGCNNYFGSVSIADAALSFGPLGATRMACPGEIGDREAGFLAALSKVEGYAFEDGKLVLSGADGKALVRLSRSE